MSATILRIVIGLGKRNDSEVAPNEELLTCPKESQCQLVHTSCGLLPQSSLHQVLAHL